MRPLHFLEGMAGARAVAWRASRCACFAFLRCLRTSCLIAVRSAMSPARPSALPIYRGLGESVRGSPRLCTGCAGCSLITDLQHVRRERSRPPCQKYACEDSSFLPAQKLLRCVPLSVLRPQQRLGKQIPQFPPLFYPERACSYSASRMCIVMMYVYRRSVSGDLPSSFSSARSLVDNDFKGRDSDPLNFVRGSRRLDPEHWRHPLRRPGLRRKGRLLIENEGYNPSVGC